MSLLHLKLRVLLQSPLQRNTLESVLPWWQESRTPKTPFSIDFGVGDVVVPNQEKRRIPTQLEDFVAPTVNTYSLETTIAEKLMPFSI